jgi:hypothetical protein
MKRRFLALATAGALALALPGVALAADETFRGELSTESEVPPPTVPADYAGGGTATVVIQNDGESVLAEFSFEGLTGDLQAAHIHLAPPGEAGPVAFPFDTAGAGTSGNIQETFTEEDFVPNDAAETYAEALEMIRSGNAYVNLHTEANPKGELRADLTAAPPDTSTEAPTSTTLPLVLAGLLLIALGLAGARMSTVRVRA